MIRTALVLVLTVGLGWGVQGCHPEDCRNMLQCPAPWEPAAPTCDPAAGRLDDDCDGVFVSSTAGSDDNTGSPAAPVRTLGKALALAQTGTRRVYACAETFVEAVQVPAGVELWGGLDCGSGWAYTGTTSKTTITPEPGAIPLRFGGGSGRALVADVHAQAANAQVPSGSSIAALVSPEAVVEIIRSELVAGDGAAGAPGRSGGDWPAKAGNPGSAGGEACSASVVAGGGATVNSCRGIDSIGGNGGYGDVTQGGSGANGQPEPTPNPQADGLGGAGWTGGSLCKDGLPGAEGANGVHGKGASGGGSITEEGWRGQAGQDGTVGLPGQGGGGGGGSRGGALFCGAAQGGASGGAGGTGGCGGKHGTGGGYGGASIGLLSLSGEVVIRSTSIKTGRGGDGGAGGRGQLGGAPGPGGSGGASVNFSPAGCRGGDGGKGGSGGHAGGGQGGPSIGILHSAGMSPLQEDVFVRTDAAGQGGQGGDPNVPGSSGEDGFRGDVLGFPQ